MGGAFDARALQARQAQSRRDQILAATHGGHDGPTGYTTDFAATSNGRLVGLRRMVEDADPGTLDQIAAEWTAVSNVLTGAQEEFLAHTQAATSHWSGAAADGFTKRAGELHEALGNGAAYAGKLSFGVSHAADSLRTAKQDMPKVPGLWDRASRAATSETNANQFNQDLASGMSRDAAIKLDGGQLSLTEERRQQAIVVLQQLEGQYLTAATVIGTPINVPFGDDKGIYPPAPPVVHAPVAAPAGDTPSAPRQSSGAAAASETAGGRIPGFGTPASPGRSKAVADRAPAEPLPAGAVIDGRNPAQSASGTPPPAASGAGSGPGGSTVIDSGLPPLSGSGPTGPTGSQSAGSRGTTSPGPVATVAKPLPILGEPLAERTAGGGHEPGRIGTPRVYGPDGPPLVEESVYVTPATSAVPAERAGASLEGVVEASAAERPGSGEGMMPFGMGGGTGGGSGSGRRASKRRRHSSADEKQTAVGEEFAGSEGINEMLLPSAEAEQERLAGAVAELRGGSSGGQALPRAGIVPTRARRKQQTRSRAQYLLEDKETWSGPTANPPVIR